MGSLVCSHMILYLFCTKNRSAQILGIYVSYANKFEDPEIIPVSALEVPLALVPVYSQRLQQDLWISISFDHVTFLFIAGWRAV
jgi:hypothetical protein